jgi:DNA-binding Lrp family transcriptional regulator
MTEAQVLGVVRSLSRRGAIRRIAASLAHRRLGVRGNLLCAWRVPSRRVNAIGRAMASFPEVSHCYERETPPDWPWNVFTMIHGRTVADALRTVRAIRAKTGLADYVVLQSTRELKKTWPRV